MSSNLTLPIKQILYNKYLWAFTYGCGYPGYTTTKRPVESSLYSAGFLTERLDNIAGLKTNLSHKISGTWRNGLRASLRNWFPKKSESSNLSVPIKFTYVRVAK